MSDLEKFLELYRSVGIEPAIRRSKENDDINGDYIGGNDITLTLDVFAQRDKITGFPGFYTTLVFDETGKFKLQSIFE